MKFLSSLLLAATLLAVAVLATTGRLYEAWFVAFIGSAAATPWSQMRPDVFASNVIADDLKLTKVLDAAIVGLRAALAPLRLFSSAASREAINGAGNDDDNSITVPVYSFTRGDVKDRAPGESYSSKVSSTSTQARKIKINKEKVVGLSFTNEEAQNQVRFDPEMHGLIKGRDLAVTIMEDIFGSVRYGNFGNRTLPPIASTAFDVNDVADLAQIGMEDFWPQLPAPGLALNPAYHFALVKQPAILDASQSGSRDALLNARINQIMGMEEVGSPGIPLNNWAAGKTFTATAATDVCACVGHALLTGDQVTVANAGGGLPAGLAAATYYYVIKVDADSFKLAASLADAQAGTAIDLTSAGTGTHSVKLMTNLVGVAGATSGIITGFRPVLPTLGIRHKLIAFELVTDKESDLTLEYRHIADEDKGEEYQIIGCHYGSEYGLAEALKLISKPL
jgi:hypothetical protein